MLEAYTLNATVPAGSSIQFNNTVIQKGCTAILSSPSTIELNKCGVYMVSVDATSTAATTIQLVKDDVALNQAQSTGTSPSFTTLVQVDRNNSCCPCASPVTLQVKNTGTASATYDNVNVVVTKIV